MNQKKTSEKEASVENAPGLFGLTKKQRSYIYTGLFILTVLVFFIVNNSNGESVEGPYPPNYNPSKADERQPAPDFSLLTPDGKTIRLSDFKGKVVILDFWATWCLPCKEGIPDLVSLKKQFEVESFEIIGISLDGITNGGETLKDVEGFIRQNNMNYPVVFGDNELLEKYGGIKSIPTSFVLDREGKIVSRYSQLVPKTVYYRDLQKLFGSN
ncbi:MAG: TlpA family protein disulfide reductase [Ignavibacteriales bacterium]|nr:TlpA family protein disulfide reductase [Ignavibacteriales bacterium]MCF8306543.1 TlpA family protein disulfide reductase [Ignavibacteriales bacterium]MCF8316342.1 TlpA family protein disulfide reductase [Ignavibacteriales bacterium]MCF8437700.1 TlpA family protein disulfide reductase [Ignavibacteriales bacterium]